MEVSMNCPFCLNRMGREDTRGHFYYNTESHKGFCFRCAKKYRGPEPEHTEVRTSVAAQTELDNPQSLYPLLIDHDDYLVVKKARQYLKNHHVAPEKTAWTYRLMIDGDSLVFPVYNSQGDMIWWQKRSMFRKTFFGKPGAKPLFSNASSSMSGSVFVVESWMNAVRLRRHSQAVALFGKYLSPEKAEQLTCSVPDSSIFRIWLDPGELCRSIAISRILRQMGARTSVVIEDRGDVCELPTSVVRRIVNEGMEVKRQKGDSD